jgi:molybdenum cofactor sulfurtransferase
MNFIVASELRRLGRISQGQSNVTGLKAPLYILQHASAQGFHTLLDAAALAPTTRISLSGSELNNSVDAMAVSMYKIVGYPTGVGALVIKKKFLEQLRKPWFAGGTVDVAQVPGEAYTLVDGSPRFEVCHCNTILSGFMLMLSLQDGTVNFLSMPAIPPGLSLMTRLIPVLAPRLACLTHWTARALSGVKHQRTGRPLVHVRSPSPTLSLSALSQTQGALIAFEVSDASGEFVNCEAIEYGAGKDGICLRAGCMCNPGGTSNVAEMRFMMDDVSSGDRKEDLEARFGVRSRGVIVSFQYSGDSGCLTVSHFSTFPNREPVSG